MNYFLPPSTITIAVHHFPPAFKGGAEWRAHRTAKWLQSRGHAVKVICVESITDTTTPNLRWIDEEFDGLPVRRLFLNLANAPAPDQWEYDNPWIETHLEQYLAATKPDIFHLISGYLMTAGAIKAANRLNIPVALTLTDFWFLCPRHTLYRSVGQVCPRNTALDCVRCNLEQKRRFRLPAQHAATLTRGLWQVAKNLPDIAGRVSTVEHRGQTLKDALARVNIAICPSNFLKQTYQERGFTAARMHFLRQGLAHIPPAPPQKSPSDRLRVGYIGQIAPHKGVHVLVEAFLKVAADHSNRAELKLYGNTDQFPRFYRRLQRRANTCPHIRFAGTFDNRDIGRVYREIDVLVVPSIWYENSPNVILEAYAHQTPVIASNLGGMAELVSNRKTGLLFEPDNANDLARQLKTVLNNRTWLNTAQKNITPPATLAAEMAELEQIYRSILA